MLHKARSDSDTESSAVVLPNELRNLSLFTKMGSTKSPGIAKIIVYHQTYCYRTSCYSIALLNAYLPSSLAYSDQNHPTF